MLFVLLGSVPSLWAEGPNFAGMTNQQILDDISDRISGNNGVMDTAYNDLQNLGEDHYRVITNEQTYEWTVSRAQEAARTVARVSDGIRYIDMGFTELYTRPNLTTSEQNQMGVAFATRNALLERVQVAESTLNEFFAWAAIIDLYLQEAHVLLTHIDTELAYVYEDQQMIAELIPWTITQGDCETYYLWWTTEGERKFELMDTRLEGRSSQLRTLINVDAQQIATAPIWIFYAVFGRPNPVDVLNAQWQNAIMGWNGAVARVNSWYNECLLSSDGGNAQGIRITVIDGQLFMIWAEVGWYETDVVSTYGENGACLQSFYVIYWWISYDGINWGVYTTSLQAAGPVRFNASMTFGAIGSKEDL
jgi:hypothetical protein